MFAPFRSLSELANSPLQTRRVSQRGLYLRLGFRKTKTCPGRQRNSEDEFS